MDTTTIKLDLAYWKQQALLVQDACNLAAVLRSFVRWIDWTRNINMTWDQVDAHPVTILFASKVQSMTDGSMLGFSKAHDACQC